MKEAAITIIITLIIVYLFILGVTWAMYALIHFDILDILALPFPPRP